VSAEGAQAIVLEQGPVVGGKRAAWLSGDSGLDPRLAAVDDNESVEILTLAELESLSGEAGDFTATIGQRPRFVTADCTRCNHCVPVCPQVVANEYDVGLTFRKAIHSPRPEAIPESYVIDLDACLNVPPNYLPCQRCVEVCDDNAIFFDMPLRESLERRVGAVIVATGFACDSAAEKSVLEEFGYGHHADVVSSVELQRLLEDPGPSGGFAVRPSDEEYPESVLMVLTRVSSSAAWVMSNQLRRLADQDVEDLAVLILAQPGELPELVDLQDALATTGAELRWGNWIGLQETGEGRLLARYAEFPAGGSREHQADMVVLSSEVHADAAAASLAEKLGLALDGQGYITPSRPGIHVAGGALGTVGIEAGAEQAREAAREALLHLQSAAEDPGDELVDWVKLPPENQREYLEQMLHTLFSLGERE
jgi:heterodisulfide reductase subunit A